MEIRNLIKLLLFVFIYTYSDDISKNKLFEKKLIVSYLPDYQALVSESSIENKIEYPFVEKKLIVLPRTIEAQIKKFVIQYAKKFLPEFEQLAIFNSALETIQKDISTRLISLIKEPQIRESTQLVKKDEKRAVMLTQKEHFLSINKISNQTFNIAGYKNIALSITRDLSTIALLIDKIRREIINLEKKYVFFDANLKDSRELLLLWGKALEKYAKNLHDWIIKIHTAVLHASGKA